MGSGLKQQQKHSSVLINKLKTEEQANYRQKFLTELNKQFDSQNQEELMKINTLTTQNTFPIYQRLKKKNFKNVWKYTPIKQLPTLHHIETALAEKEALLIELHLIEALELYEGCIRCFLKKKFENKEVFAECLLALAQFVLFANDLQLLHKAAACMLKEAQWWFESINKKHKELPNVHMQLGFYLLKQKSSGALEEFLKALEYIKQNQVSDKENIDSIQILELYQMITMVINMKKEITETDRIMYDDAMKLIEKYSLDGLGKEVCSRTRHSIVSIRNNRAIRYQKEDKLDEAISLLQSNLASQLGLAESYKNQSDIIKTQALLDECKSSIVIKEDSIKENELVAEIPDEGIVIQFEQEDTEKGIKKKLTNIDKKSNETQEQEDEQLLKQLEQIDNL